MHRSLTTLCVACLMAVAAPSCTTSGGAGGPMLAARDAQILAEPRGDYYIGRRYFTDKTRYWGYVRKPGQLWDKAVLVLMDERRGRLTPDRLLEQPSTGNAHGYDHNYEYKISGAFTGQQAYDPNADMILPLFAATNYEVISAKPGFLFTPGERYNPKYISAREAKRQTEYR